MTVEAIKKEVERLVESVGRIHRFSDSSDVRIFCSGALCYFTDLLDFINEADQKTKENVKEILV